MARCTHACMENAARCSLHVHFHVIYDSIRLEWRSIHSNRLDDFVLINDVMHQFCEAKCGPNRTRPEGEVPKSFAFVKIKHLLCLSGRRNPSPKNSGKQIYEREADLPHLPIRNKHKMLVGCLRPIDDERFRSSDHRRPTLICSPRCRCPMPVIAIAGTQCFLG